MLPSFLLLFFSIPGTSIPVTNQTVIAKCGTCHTVDDHGNMQRVSYTRSTPEGWQAALKRMLQADRLTLTQLEARDIVRYLSDNHGLAPAESRPFTYEPERRVHDETSPANQSLLDACAKCHTLAKALSWRRSPDEWKQFAEDHSKQYKFKTNNDTLNLLSAAAPFETPEWLSWSGRTRSPALTGRWLVTAHLQGQGKFYGDLVVTEGRAQGEYFTHVKLRSIKDGSTVERAGRFAVYSGHQWRGRSAGLNMTGTTPDNPLSDARESIWISPDGLHAEGRWFWGFYQEFGFDVSMQRSSGPTLLALDITSLKAGTTSNRVRLIGDHLPSQVTPADISVGPGISVRRIISNSATEVTAEFDVDTRAALGRRDVAVASSRLPAAIAIYDRIDYIKVSPDSAMAAFTDDKHARGFQQFEAIAYQRGPDGRLHTADDLELGPVEATWSMEVFYETDTSQHDTVGTISQSGFFTPASKNPGMNYDVWVIATAQELTGKSYVVVTVPTYTFQGHTYVRDLDRWTEEQ